MKPRLAAMSGFGEWLLEAAFPFALILYLALRGGGYDVVVRDEVGIAVWLLILLGVAAGVLPRAMPARRARFVFALLLGFTIWTGLAIIWSESAERSFEELARVGTYLGIFCLVVAGQRRDVSRRTLGAVGAAIAAVAVLALLSRLHPAWFPTDELARAQPPDERGRLNYPLNHWGALSAFMAIGAPLLLTVASQGRLLARSAATAVLPILALVSFYTYSRSGAIAAVVALLLFFALYPKRLAALIPAALAMLGSGVLIAAAVQRDALQDGTATALAHDQGTEMIALTTAVCLVVALIRAVAATAERGLLARTPVVSRRVVGWLAAVTVAAALIAAVAVDLPGRASDGWQDFKSSGNETSSARLQSVSGNGRYQYWQSALHATATDPLVGIGPGTFEYWWARDGTLPGFTRYAHSLYFETLAELGVVGLILIVSVIGAVLVIGVQRARAAPELERGAIAGGVASVAAFALASGTDWLWQLAVLPVTFLLVSAALVSPDEHRADDYASGTREARKLRPGPRLALIGLAMAAVATLVLSLQTAFWTAFFRDGSGGDSRAGLREVVADSGSAADLQPFAATPHLQAALALEQLGELESAAAEAKVATEKESTNWRTWYALARIEDELGRNRDANRSATRLLSLNPRSPLVNAEYANITGDFSYFEARGVR